MRARWRWYREVKRDRSREEEVGRSDWGHSLNGHNCSLELWRCMIRYVGMKWFEGPESGSDGFRKRRMRQNHCLVWKYTVLLIHRIGHLLVTEWKQLKWLLLTSSETFRGVRQNKTTLLLFFFLSPAGTMAFVWEMGISSHGHALICMLSSLKTGTTHCERCSSRQSNLISPSQQIPLELVKILFSNQLERTSVWGSGDYGRCTSFATVQGNKLDSYVISWLKYVHSQSTTCSDMSPNRCRCLEIISQYRKLLVSKFLKEWWFLFPVMCHL